MNATALRIPLTILAATMATTMLTGCTPDIDNDPFYATLSQAATQVTQFTLEGEPLRSCGGNTPACVSPVFTVQYTAPADVTPADACSALTTLAFSTAKPAAYASVGAPAGTLPVLDPQIATHNFCTTGVSQAMPSTDNTIYYQGTMLIDPGITDQVAKHFTLGREPDGTYRLTVDFSRNIDTMWWEIQDTPPAHFTLEQAEQQNDNLTIQAATQQFADTLVGKTEQVALTAIRTNGYTSQVIQRDSVETQPTGYDPKRILLQLKDGIVVGTFTG